MPGIRDFWLSAHGMIRSARQIVNENLLPLGLSSSEGNILLHLLSHGPELRQEQIVEQLDISKPAVSRALDSLEAKGLVIRQQNPDDKRAHRVQLTDRAREIGPAVERAYDRVYCIATQGMSREELDRFVRMLGTMSENLSRGQGKQ